MLIIAGAAFAQVGNEVVVEGKSSVKIAPEQYLFGVHISVKDSNYTTCGNKALEEADKIAKQFEAQGIDKDLIKTQRYSIQEIRERDYTTNKMVFKGYRAEIPLTITTHADYKKNDLIFEIIKNNFGANFNLNFGLTPEQTNKVKERLIALAVKDANEKAGVIANSANITLGGINKIQYGEPRLIRGFSSTSYDLQQNEIMLRGSSSLKAGSVLNPSEVEMRTSIIIAWQIKK
jgi:uncharacterized protein YggE